MPLASREGEKDDCLQAQRPGNSHSHGGQRNPQQILTMLLSSCYPEDMDERVMVTVAETADALGLKVGTVNRRLRLGQMRGYKVNARLWLVPSEEVERAKAQGRMRPGPKPGSRRRTSAAALLAEDTEHRNVLEAERQRIRDGQPPIVLGDEDQTQ